MNIKNYIARLPLDAQKGIPEKLTETSEVSKGRTAPLVELVVGKDFIYFTDEASETIWRVSKEGGEPIAFISGVAQPMSLLINEGYIYWVNSIDDGGVYRLKL